MAVFVVNNVGLVFLFFVFFFCFFFFWGRGNKRRDTEFQCTQNTFPSSLKRAVQHTRKPPYKTNGLEIKKIYIYIKSYKVLGNCFELHLIQKYTESKNQALRITECKELKY